MAYRENCVLVNDEDTDHCESNRFSAQSTQKHVYLQRTTHTHTSTKCRFHSVYQGRSWRAGSMGPDPQPRPDEVTCEIFTNPTRKFCATGVVQLFAFCAPVILKNIRSRHKIPDNTPVNLYTTKTW